MIGNRLPVSVTGIFSQSRKRSNRTTFLYIFCGCLIIILILATRYIPLNELQRIAPYMSSLFSSQIELDSEDSNHQNEKPSQLRGRTEESSIFAVSTKKAERLLACPGVIILGMHRSGTSMLSGLIKSLGFQTGGPLLPEDQFNSKGYYERKDIAQVNDYLLKNQGASSFRNTYKFNTTQGALDLRLALRQYHIAGALGKQHQDKNYAIWEDVYTSLLFMTQSSNIPWLIKDPRITVTLRSWLTQLSNYNDTNYFKYYGPPV